MYLLILIYCNFNLVFAIDVSNSLHYGVSVSADNIIAHFEINEV